MPQIILDENDSLCPSCERYIGFVTECPYCDADSYKGSLIVKMRVMTLLIAVAGSILLGLSALCHSIPILTVSGIGASANGRIVRLSGQIDGRVTASEADGNISFNIKDGTGRIKVIVDSTCAQMPALGGQKLKQGMRLSLVGRISLGDDGRARFLARGMDGDILDVSGEEISKSGNGR